jgi:hypothetical protein
LLLDEVLSPVLDPEDIELIQRYAGLILIGGNRAQKPLMLTGLGGTGKGTLVNLITAINIIIMHPQLLLLRAKVFRAERSAVQAEPSI